MTLNSGGSSLMDFKGCLFDLDGVITNTTTLHAQAWKQMFDDFLAEYGAAKNQKFEPFSIAEDYPNYIDGNPRVEGVKSFLESRGINLPWNDMIDGNEEFTIESLDRKKYEIFHQLLKESAIEVYHENSQKIVEWRRAGIKTGVISGYKNCASILNKTNLNTLFDVRVDGVIAEQNNLQGKPEPDYYMEGAKQLGLSPDECIVFEDDISGVRAANEGGFGFVVGVSTMQGKEMLLKNGADITVSHLNELSDFLLDPQYSPEKLANARDQRFLENVSVDRELALFLDYDGTLTPIVNKPEDAVLSDSMKQVLADLAHKIPVAVISGRDCGQLASLVGIDDIYYAGSHGFDIQGPGGFTMQVSKARSLLPVLGKAEKSLREQTENLTGVRIERKQFAIAVHFRNSAQKEYDALEPIVTNVTQQYENLKLNGGKKVFELKPNVDWDKGKAVDWLLKELNIDGSKRLPFYFGDDLTDEDAFRALLSKGVSILVGDHGHKTFAKYYLEDVTEVEWFLKAIKAKLENAYAR